MLKEISRRQAIEIRLFTVLYFAFAIVKFYISRVQGVPYQRMERHMRLPTNTLSYEHMSLLSK